MPLVFAEARKNALAVFWGLTRARSDERLDEREQQRAQVLLDQILAPYQRLTDYLAKYPPGSVEHDVSMLLLTKHPMDYDKPRHRWSVRLLSEVCRTHLGTRSASKSQVGRFYKHLGWHKQLTHKLVSPDPAYGEKMKTIGHTLAHLTAKDVWVVGDEFKFTSAKVRDVLAPTHAPTGLCLHVQDDYGPPSRPTCALNISGLFEPRTRRLETAELPSFDHQGYLTTLSDLAQRFLPADGGKLYIGLDNGKIHGREELQEELREIIGDQVYVLFFPTYEPNNNPIENIWHQLLGASYRTCATPQELRQTYQVSLDAYEQWSQSQPPLPPTLHCFVCGQTFQFAKTPDLELANQIENHLCFNIPHLNPYTIQVLTHSLEVFRLGHLG